MAGALVSKSKGCLEKHKRDREDPLPDPDIEGGGGKADEWNWSTLRPWLERRFNRSLSSITPELLLRMRSSGR
jgi:hypothetical protein